jgi:hypothetical protein
MAGGQVLLSNLGFEVGHEHEESQEAILSAFTERMMGLFSRGDEE